MFKIALQQQLQCLRRTSVLQTKPNMKFLSRSSWIRSSSSSSPLSISRALLKSIRGPIHESVRGAKRIEAHGPIEVMKDFTPPAEIPLLPESRYGGENTVTLLSGDSSVGKKGAEYVEALMSVARVHLEHIAVQDDEEYENEYIISVLRNRNAIHIDARHDPVRKSMNRRINNDLNLFATVVKLHCFEGFNCRFPALDLLMILQNNTGDLTKLEYEPVDGVVETLCIADERGVRQYLEFVFEYTENNCRKKITIPHKVSALPRTDGMFLRVAYDLQQTKYPHIALEKMSVGKMSMALVECPQMFDVICAGDRYGTFLTSIASAICGGAGLFSAMEMSKTHAVFKPLQTKLSISNTRTLSPYGIVRACVDLLSHLGNTECAHLLWKELLASMLERCCKTPEFGGTNREEFVICDIINNLKCKIP